MSNKTNDQLYSVEEFHRGKWIPVLVDSKKGEEKEQVKKVVRTTEDYAKILNGDSNETGIRYVVSSEKVQTKKDNGGTEGDLTPAQQAKELKEKVLVMKTVEDIDKAIDGITWNSVLKAAEKRKKELNA